ncbi:MAG: hypothetical protein KGQ28_02010 [Hyphomicrobiales bacterium]|nr:hypothetical protein [Hyphomicrobiales bacterium]
MRRAARGIAAAALAAFAFPALAAPPFLGAWAASKAACADDAMRFHFDATAFSTGAFGCAAATYAADGAGWRVRASRCIGENPSAKDWAMDFRVEPVAGGAIRVHWSDGTDSPPLARCPR